MQLLTVAAMVNVAVTGMITVAVRGMVNVDATVAHLALLANVVDVDIGLVRQDALEDEYLEGGGQRGG